MPWPWKVMAPSGSRATVIQGSNGPTLTEGASVEPMSPLPLRTSWTFHVDDVYFITGIGCLAAGEVVEGHLQPPADARIVPGTGSITQERDIRVVSASVARREQAMVGQGVKAGLKLTGIEPEWRLGIPHYDLRKGDSISSR
jgi:translation elongation factor EF-1alpha